MQKFIPLIFFILLLNIIAFGTHKIANQQYLLQNELPQFSLPLLSDQQKFLSNNDINNNKYSLLNFFASWCNSCQLEHHLLIELKDNKNINLYGIAWRDIDQKTKSFLENNGDPYKIVVTDSKNELGKKLNLKGTPESFLIDKSGVIVFHKRGPLSRSDINKIKSFTNSHLKMNNMTKYF